MVHLHFIMPYIVGNMVHLHFIMHHIVANIVHLHFILYPIVANMVRLHFIPYHFADKIDHLHFASVFSGAKSTICKMLPDNFGPVSTRLEVPEALLAAK